MTRALREGYGLLGMSDHRPVVAFYSGLLAQGSRDRFTPAYSQARTLNISRFCPSPKQLKDYQDALVTSSSFTNTTLKILTVFNPQHLTISHALTVFKNEGERNLFSI